MIVWLIWVMFVFFMELNVIGICGVWVFVDVLIGYCVVDELLDEMF